MRWLRLFLSVRSLWLLISAVLMERQLPWRALVASVSMLALALIMLIPILLLGALAWLICPPLVAEYRMTRRIAMHRETREMERQLKRTPSMLSGCPHCKHGEPSYYDHDEFPMQVMPMPGDPGWLEL